MKIVGITGSVAMGKSSTVKMLRYLGYPVFDADATVAGLYRDDQGFLQEIKTLFPESAGLGSQVDKALLAQRVFSDPSARKLLESLIHPRVSRLAERFALRHQRLRTNIIFWDVPLLFQSELQYYCAEIWVVAAPEALQRRRALQRTGWSQERFEAIRDVQVAPNRQKTMADRIIPTGLGKAHTLRCVKRSIALYRSRRSSLRPQAPRGRRIRAGRTVALL